MADKVKLADGRSIALKCDQGTWHASIDGKYYCAADKETLVTGLQSSYQFYLTKIIVPEKPPLQIATETLKSENSSLVARREAVDSLERLSGQGDVVATVLLDQLSKKKVSRSAQEITKRLKKNNFADVTHEELVQHVNNLVLRAQLILELSERLRF